MDTSVFFAKKKIIWSLRKQKNARAPFTICSQFIFSRRKTKRLSPLHCTHWQTFTVRCHFNVIRLSKWRSALVVETAPAINPSKARALRRVTHLTLSSYPSSFSCVYVCVFVCPFTEYLCTGVASSWWRKMIVMMMVAPLAGRERSSPSWARHAGTVATGTDRIIWPAMRCSARSGCCCVSTHDHHFSRYSRGRTISCMRSV